MKRAHLCTFVHLCCLASFESTFAGYYDNVFGIAIAHSVHEIYGVFAHSLDMLTVETRCKLSGMIWVHIPIIG